MMIQHPNDDPRLADFKLLLPLNTDARVLVLDCADVQWLPYLTTEIGTVDVVSKSAQTQEWEAVFERLTQTVNVRALAAPDGEYDLILTDSPDGSRFLAKGGVLCHFNHYPQVTGRDLNADNAEGVQHSGRWWPLPGWPSFRALVPDRPDYIAAAQTDLHLLSQGSGMKSLANTILPKRRTLPSKLCIDLFQRASSAPLQSVIEQINRALTKQAGLKETTPEPWLLVSGRLGPGNPIVVFQTGADGKLKRLIKIARFAGTRHLIEEAEKINEIRSSLGDTLASVLITPSAVVSHQGRAAIAYDFVPTRPFFGLRWRLKTRRGFCIALSDWLGDIARQTLQARPQDEVWKHHIAPLEALCARKILPSSMQQAAQTALNRLKTADTLPQCLEHGDLGIYNTRLCSSDGRHFRVLDWASSTPAGIALGDLGYLLASAHAPASLSVHCMRRYLDNVSLPHSLAGALWFAYLARRWAELDTIRPIIPGDPTSGGGILIDVHQRIADALAKVSA